MEMESIYQLGGYVAGITFGLGSFLVARRQAKTTERELDELYRTIDDNAKRTGERVVNQYFFNLDSDVEMLPKRGISGSKLFKSSRESVPAYLVRVFRTFDLWRNEDLLVAKRKSLAINFDLSEERIDEQLGGEFEVDIGKGLFGYHHDSVEVRDDVRIRTHNVRATYNSHDILPRHSYVHSDIADNFERIPNGISRIAFFQRISA